MSDDEDRLDAAMIGETQRQIRRQKVFQDLLDLLSVHFFSASISRRTAATFFLKPKGCAQAMLWT